MFINHNTAFTLLNTRWILSRVTEAHVLTRGQECFKPITEDYSVANTNLGQRMYPHTRVRLINVGLFRTNEVDTSGQVHTATTAVPGLPQQSPRYRILCSTRCLRQPPRYRAVLLRYQFGRETMYRHVHVHCITVGMQITSCIALRWITRAINNQ